MTEAFEQTQAATLDRHGVVAERRLIDVPVLDGGRAQVLVTGDGPSIVLVNGIGIPAAMWAPLIAHVAGFTVYAVDLPGYGLTDPLPRLADHLRDDAVTFLEQVLDRLDVDDATVVANSLGSLWALWLAVDRPHRVRRMVHVGCPALAPGTSAPLPMRLLSCRPLGRLLMRIQPPSPAQVVQLAKTVHEHPLPPEIADLILETERLPHFEPSFRAMLHRLLRVRGARPDVALGDGDLTAVSQPNLVIVGRDDPMGSRDAGERMVRALPDASLHVVDGGHAPWLDEPGRIAELTTTFLRDR